MKLLLTLILFTIAASCKSQSVLVMDFVKVKNDKYAETIYYYEHNWKLYRVAALKKGYIKDFRIEKTTADSIAAFDLILITEYKDKESYNKSEENFSGLLKSLRPDGPVLLNDIKPIDFRQNLFVKVTENVFQSKKKRRRR